MNKKCAFYPMLKREGVGGKFLPFSILFCRKTKNPGHFSYLQNYILIGKTTKEILWNSHSNETDRSHLSFSVSWPWLNFFCEKYF